MTYLSLCSGIEAATVAWHPLGWKPLAFCEIEKFPSAVLAHHWPTIPNLGNMTEHANWPNDLKPDLLVGGTPCQAFSVAGLRKGLSDARGNLSLTFCRIADQFNPDWIVWENVPGVLSSKDNAFGCFLAGLAGEDDPLLPAGTKWSNAGYVRGPKRTIAWRILDAQYFGVAQRRRRVFVIASPTDRHDPTEVLFEFDGVRRDSPPSRKAGQITPTIPARSLGGGGLSTAFDCDGGLIEQPYEIGNTLTARMQKGINSTLDEGQTPIICRSAKPAWQGCDCCDEHWCNVHQMHTAECECPPLEDWGEVDPYSPLPPAILPFDTTQITSPQNGCNPNLAVPMVYGVSEQPDVAHCLRSGASKADKHESTTYIVEKISEVTGKPVAFDTTQLTSPQNGCNPKPGDPCHPLSTGAHPPAVAFRVHGEHSTAMTGNGNAAVASAVQTARCLDTCGGYSTNQGGNVVLAAHPPAVAFNWNAQASQLPNPERDCSINDGMTCSQQGAVATAMQVRRLTPIECERLQGFPDNHTLIPWRNKPADQCPDGPRYKALGNSMAVPVMHWIGQRIHKAHQEYLLNIL